MNEKIKKFTQFLKSQGKKINIVSIPQLISE